MRGDQEIRDHWRLTNLLLAVTESPQVFVTVTILVILLRRHRLVVTDLCQALRTEGTQSTQSTQYHDLT